VEISPSGACNYRCIFCAFDYLNYEPELLDNDLMIKSLDEMHENGVKSIVVCGEGEPLLNKNTPAIINYAKKIGLDVGMATNGILFTPEVADYCLKSLTWIRVSLNAGSDENHQLIHKSKAGDFEKILANIAEAVKLKKNKKLNCTIGVQLLLIAENSAEVLILAKELKALGVDYFTVKPFSKHPASHTQIEQILDYKKYLDMEKELSGLKTLDFNIVFRSASMKKLQQKRNYTECLGIPFWAYIDAQANVWPCIAYIGNEAFRFGNLKEQGFREIWEGEKRKQVLAFIKSMDIDACRELCRLDEINRYLHEIKYPSGHINFI
jgi:radical SAM protein with 4Fe4S-binding SPASM domain